MKIFRIFTGLLIIGVLISGCLIENENMPREENDNDGINYDGTIYNYSTSGFEINKTQASIVWGKVNFSDDAKFVSREKDYSVIIFVQSFNENPSDPSSAEWIAVATSIPRKNEDVKIAIFRLDYQTLDFRRSYYFSYPGGKNLSSQQSAFFMEEEMKKEPKSGKFVDEKMMALYGGNYISSYPGSFSGGTIIMNKYTGKVIFHATTVQGGRSSGLTIERGRIITPGEDTNGTSPFNTEIRVESISSPAYRGTTTITGLSFTVPDFVPNGSEIHVDYRTEMLHTDGSLEPEPAGFNIIPEKKRLALVRVYLFTWGDIPGKDSKKLIEYLERNYFLMDWLKTAKIEKIDNDRTIRVFNETESILLKLNDEKNKIDLRTGIYAPHELSAKTDNNKLRVYDKQSYFERGNGRLVAYSNLTVKTWNASVEGDYFITATVKYRGWDVGKGVLSFKIDKGGKKSGGKSVTEGSWNIGYSADNPLPLNRTEKEKMITIALGDPELKGKRYKLEGVTSEFLDLENYSGFFAVVTVDVGDPDYPGEIIRYIVDREEKKIIGSSATMRKALEYFKGEAFDEAKGNFTKRWDSWNFPGLWIDNETNTSTETLVIDQGLLNNSYRIIDRHNLIYTTNMIPLKYLVYAQINWTPEGTDGAYQAIGWMGEKHVYLQGNRLAKIIFEQNATEEKEMTIGESWELGEGYKLIANSISAKDAGGRQAWITLFKGSNKLFDTVMVQQFPNKFFSYRMNLSDSTPNFMIYYSRVDSLPRTDAAYFKYTWLRSNDTTEIKPGGIFSIMEVTSVDNGRIELRNRVPLELAPDSTINLMGNLNIKVGSSNTSLAFHPYRVRKP